MNTCGNLLLLPEYPTSEVYNTCTRHRRRCNSYVSQRVCMTAGVTLISRADVPIVESIAQPITKTVTTLTASAHCGGFHIFVMFETAYNQPSAYPNSRARISPISAELTKISSKWRDKYLSTRQNQRLAIS